MSYPTSTQRAATPIINEAIALWKLRTPSGKLGTGRLVRLRDRYDLVIGGLKNSGHPYDFDVMLSEMQSARDGVQGVLERRLMTEQYGPLHRIAREAIAA